MPSVINPLVYINGTALPQSSTYNATSATLVDSARNAEGFMIGAVIRDNVSKVELTWNYLTLEQWARVCNIPFMSDVEFYDQDKAGWSTKELYKSDRTAELLHYDQQTHLPKGWKNCRLALIMV